MNEQEPIRDPIWSVVASWYAPDGSDVDLLHAVAPPGGALGGSPPCWDYDGNAAAAADEAERAGEADYDPDVPRAWSVQHNARGHYFRSEAGARVYIRERWGLVSDAEGVA